MGGSPTGGISAACSEASSVVAAITPEDLGKFYDNSGTVSQQQAIFPNCPDFGRMRRIEKRKGLSAGLQWKPNDEFEVNVDHTYSRFDRPDNQDFSTLRMDGGNILSGVFEPGGIPSGTVR